MLLTAIAATSPAGGSPAHVPSLVTLDGVGGVRPGMTVGQVERRFGVKLRLDDLGTECAPGFFRSGAAEGYGLFIRAKLGSVWFERGARTDRGIRIGSTFAELQRAYSRVSIRKDKYVPRARNVFVRRERAPHWRIRFDVSPQNRVTRIAFGNWTVFLVEGCA
ncbi:MAG: hypothetical protein OEW52_10160 [Thermoleophilia bacterium]|nr:hypothetical protein [Thermoleophilia bacterium]MDH5281494.1 hypothetical protein [Thermoleophilia bacterium]